LSESKTFLSKAFATILPTRVFPKYQYMVYMMLPAHQNQPRQLIVQSFNVIMQDYSGKSWTDCDSG